MTLNNKINNIQLLFYWNYSIVNLRSSLVKDKLKKLRFMSFLSSKIEIHSN